MPGLPPRAAKQMRSSRGFRRTDPGGGARWARSETQPAFAAAPVETLDSARSQHEACAICLEALDDCSFNHPCGQGHRLHYDCTLHFLSSALSLPLSDESPGPLLRQEARELGRGFQAVAVLFEAMSRMPSETRLRLCCPLCRCDWPQEKQRLTELAGQLRQSRIKQVASRLGKLEEAYRQVQLRYEQRPAVQSHLLGSALGILEKNLHVASTFFSYSGPAVTCILEFLEAPAVTHLSLCSAATRQHCWEGARLCAPHIKIPVVRWARRLSAQRARSLLVDPSLATIGKLTSGLDVLSFGSWLQAAEQLQEISMVAADWERLDPGASCLARTLPRNLQILDLSQNGLTDESVMNLALKLGGRLQTLTLELNHITAKGFGALLTLAKDAAGCIRSWGFRHNQLRDESCRLLATRLDPEALGARGRLECWDLRTNGIGVEGCKWLAPLVGHMVVARLGCNPLGDKGGELLANGLGQKLQVLDLRQAQLGEAATLALGRRLREAQSLQELLLSGNQIGASGAHALAEGWAWISTLRYVDLAGNPIGAEGVDLLSDEMPFWQQAPFRLSLASTGCEEQSARKMAAVLHKNPRRNRGWTIELQNNSLSSGILVEIARLLEESLPGFTPRFR